MRVEIDKAAINGVKELMKDIKNGYEKVLVTSINKTLVTVKTQATARIGNELNLTAARIKKDMSVQKASYSRMEGALIATGRPVGLAQFGANQTSKGVIVKVKRSSPRTLLKHAFISVGKGNNKHVFWRNRDNMPKAKKFSVGKKSNAAWPKMGDKYRGIPYKRTPFWMDTLYGPRIEDILAQDKVMVPVKEQATHVFAQNVSKKIDEVLRRHG